MAAPLTVEQMILNHNIGVNISDAATFKGHSINEFLLVGATFDASAIQTGVFNNQRLPTATTTSPGVVQLSDNINSTSSNIAASSAAVNAIKLVTDGKASSVHKHSPSDINAGAFTNTLSAKSSLSLNTGVIRNIFISNTAPTNSMGSDGDVYFQYQD